MKLTRIALENFRGYEKETSVTFDDLTTFIGKNDIGKSTILEALEIFFNNDIVEIDSSDANVHSKSKIVTITCDFTELPKELDLDAGEKTSLKDEYLLISDDTLRIKKVYDCSKSKISEEIFIVANHPSAEDVSDLLSLKEKELQKLSKKYLGDGAPQKGNPIMRKAIWNAVESLELKETDIPISKSREDAKNIWAKLETYLPKYALFQSDRSSSDSDEEVQNPLKAAIREAIQEVQDDILEIEKKVREKAESIANQTHKALETLDPLLAKELTPNFSSPALSKWNSMFSISMNTEDGIALNKRGSGVRRMILVGFFKAEAERKAKESNNKDIIYAIEEPETAQHPNNQKILINAFSELSKNEHCQVILTTHSPALAAELPTDSLRFIEKDENNNTSILNGGDDVIQKIVDALGIFPDIKNRVKVLLCVEGPTDVIAFKAFSRCLREKDESVIDLASDKRVAVLPLGGSILKYWVEKKYLQNLNCPEVHIYDSDVGNYQTAIDEVNERSDGSFGTLTKKYEIENYLHTKAIREKYNVDVDTDEKGVPKLFGIQYSNLQGHPNEVMKDRTSKIYLSQVFEEKMNYDLLMERDTEGEIKGWFDRIKQLVER